MLEKLKVSIGNEEYLELEGKKIKEEIIREGRDERRHHIGDGLYSQYFIDVVVKKETWEVNNQTITVNIIEEYYKKDKPTISKYSEEIMDLLIYQGKSIDEVKTIFNIT